MHLKIKLRKFPQCASSVFSHFSHPLQTNFGLKLPKTGGVSWDGERGKKKKKKLICGFCFSRSLSPCGLRQKGRDFSGVWFLLQCLYLSTISKNQWALKLWLNYQTLRRWVCCTETINAVYHLVKDRRNGLLLVLNSPISLGMQV